MSSPSKKSAPQVHMASSTGMMLRPNGVRVQYFWSDLIDPVRDDPS